MDLLVERGLPVRPQGAGGEDTANHKSTTTTATVKAGAGAKGEKEVSCIRFNSISVGSILSLARLSASAVAQINSGVMSSPANTRPPSRLQNVGIEQHLDAQIPPDSIFRDDTGQSETLATTLAASPSSATWFTTTAPCCAAKRWQDWPAPCA